VASPLDRALGRVVTAQQQHLAALANRTAAALADTFAALPSVDDDGLELWLSEALPVVAAMQTSAVTASYAYGNTLADMVRAAIAELPAPDDIIANLRGDVTPTDVYTRPIWDARNSIAAAGFAAALTTGANRAAALGRTDVATASRAGSAATREATEGCTGYSRVPGSGACEFCTLVAANTFSLDEPAPAHNNCTCGEAPVIGHHDAGAESRDAALGELDMDPDQAASALDEMPIVPTEVGPSTP
jgi:hypothetical protein